jgi:hypothetical protein
MNYPIGATLHSGGKLLGSGTNICRSRAHLGVSTRNLQLDREMKGSQQTFHSVSIHAEIAALKSYFSTWPRLPGKGREPSRRVLWEQG